MADNDRKPIHKAVMVGANKIDYQADSGGKYEAQRPVVDYWYCKDDNDPFTEPWGLTLENDEEDNRDGTDPSPKDRGVKLLMHGVVCCEVDIKDKEDKYAVPKKGGDGELESTSQASRCEILSKSANSTGKHWCVVSLGGSGGVTQNQEAENESERYEIDRTNHEDDEKEWDPVNDKPEDWQDYKSVKLKTQILRFDSGKLNFVTVEQIWAAVNAPVIKSATTEEAGKKCG